jgi:hypothetical protein
MTVFICKECVFLCNYESDYKRHINTKKHVKNTENANNNTASNSKNSKKSIHKKCSHKNDNNINNRCRMEDIFLTHDRDGDDHNHYKGVVISEPVVAVVSPVASPVVAPVALSVALSEEFDNGVGGIHECECGKSFKSSSGLRKHKRNLCSTKDNIIMKLIKDNAEMKELMREQQKFMREQQEQYHKQLVEMIPMVCATNNTNLITNNHNHMNIKQKFNLNVFLNEQCKDALNIGDFINSLQITLDDLSITREKTLEDSVENIFLRGLKELDIYKRPIHCTDHKRDVMYIKDEEKWEKDEGNIKLKGTIGAISRKQIRKLKEWKDSDPEVTKTTSVKNDNFLLTMNHVCTPIPETSEKRLIKTIGKEVQID